MSSFIDKNFESTVQSNAIDVTPRTLDAGPEYNDTAKFSGNITNVTYGNKRIVNRNEDTLDACRVHGSQFFRLVLCPKGENGITLKGASTDNKFSGIEFETHGNRCDIELGQFDNYWYPGRAPTRRNSFSGRMPGSTYPADAVRADNPVRIVLWDADDTNTFDFWFQTIKRVPKWQWFPYFVFRYFTLRVENVVRHFRKLAPIATS